MAIYIIIVIAISPHGLVVMHQSMFFQAECAKWTRNSYMDKSAESGETRAVACSCWWVLSGHTMATWTNLQSLRKHMP
eukprot:15351312-Ditylum_brightwellii.AAC.1